MRRVTDDIWLGSLEDAQNLERLEMANIQAILNVAPHYNTPVHEGIVLFKAGIFEDSRETNPVFEAVEILDMLVAKYGPVLVHCHAGVNRSPFIVTLWLVIKTGMSFHMASALTQVGLSRWMDQWIDQIPGKRLERALVERKEFLG